jgi:alpha-1,6-mannosyltransferase
VSRRRFLALLACGGVLVGLSASGLYVQSDDGRGWFIANALAQSAVYLAALGLIRPGPATRRVLALILVVAVAARIIVLLAPPFLSSDVYRYVWDGRVLAAGINPYRYIPTDPQLAALRDAAIFPEINRGNYAPTIYPPAAELIFFAVTRLGESVMAMKAAMVVLEVVAVLLLLSLLTRAGQSATRIIVYAWHPLPLWEFAGSGHIDAAIVAFVALVLWSRRGAAISLSYRRRPASTVAVGRGLPNGSSPWAEGPRDDKRDNAGWLTGLALAGAVLVKFYPIVLFPAVWRRWDWRMPVVFAAVLVLAYLPFLGVGWGVFGFLPGYLAEEGFASGGGGFYLWGLVQTVLPPGAVPGFAYPIAAGFLLATLGVYIAVRRTGTDGDIVGAALLAGAFVILLSPHYPWYFAWLIVFACLVPSASLLWLTLASFLLYLVPVGSQLVRDRHRFLIETAIYVPFLALAALDLWRRRAREQGVEAWRAQ